MELDNLPFSWRAVTVPPSSVTPHTKPNVFVKYSFNKSSSFLVSLRVRSKAARSKEGFVSFASFVTEEDIIIKPSFIAFFFRLWFQLKSRFIYLSLVYKTASLPYFQSYYMPFRIYYEPLFVISQKNLYSGI